VLKPMAMLYDRFMRSAEEGCLTEWRHELLGSLHGDVLEIGAGTGRSLIAYPVTLTSLTLVEPDRHMRSQLDAKMHAHGAPADVVDGEAESLPFPDASFDAVVSSLVLCSVHQQDTVLREVRRVLRPGGRFVFIEHVAATDRPDRLKWQRRLEPGWRRMAGNCHLTRDTETAIRSAGFELGECERASMRGALPIIRPTIRGFAVPAAS
jgi:ubiquinone/menaquinone biosynthesis C-methylase UbiE